MKIAFLGLGTMGTAMAQRLPDVIVWNRSPARAAGFAQVAKTPADAVRDAELVITMLADEHALRDVLDAVLPALHAGQLIVEMSTVGRAAALEAAARVGSRGARFIDAPVSGSRGAARKGALLVLCGGADEDVERARPTLSAFGRVEHVGPLGAGAATKLVVNAIGAQQMIALTSALGLADRLGLDRARTLDLILAGPFGSPSFSSKRDRLLSTQPGADPEFTIALWEKDQRLVLEEAARQNYKMPSLEAARSLMQHAIEQGQGQDDMSAIGMGTRSLSSTSQD